MCPRPRNAPWPTCRCRTHASGRNVGTRRSQIYTEWPMFLARFADPTPTGRPDLSFRQGLTGTRPLKDEWGFVCDDVLRSNVAATLQEIEFDVHLVNQYNVFWTPLAMKYKHAIVQAASV